jgi:hypothetical protein
VKKESPQTIHVFGLPFGEIFIKSKFNSEGIVRSFDDLIWALKTFQFENPQVGMIGSFLKKYFQYGQDVKFFEEEKMIKLMIKLLNKCKNQSSNQSLVNLRLSISSKKDNDKETEEKIINLEKNELGDVMDASLNQEPRDSPKRR